MNNPARDTGWFKSSFSSADSDNCVEVRIIEKVVGVRDSKNVGVSFSISKAAWGMFVDGVRDTNLRAFR